MRSSSSPRLAALAGRWLAVGLFVFVGLSGCDTHTVAPTGPERAAAPSDSAYARLLADHGGIGGLADFRARASDEELAATLGRYGIAFEIVDVAASAETARFQDITACPQKFPTSDRVKWFRLSRASAR